MSDKVERLAKRLDELSQAVSQNNMNEFTMRVPAEPERDADIVLLDAATELVSLQSRLRTLAIGIVGARMALVEDDKDEAYHLLYSAARTLADNLVEPWSGVEALAAGAIERRDGQTFVKFTAVERGTPECGSPYHHEDNYMATCNLPKGHEGDCRQVFE